MRATTTAKTMESVFINCPFDDDYQPLFDAMLFAIRVCGFRPRCSLEHSDGGEVRMDKLYGLIGECRLAIHDLSRVQLTAESQLPRFNMPLELGVWLGAKRFGSNPKNKKKACLILDAQQHRYQKFISDISGQDPTAHANDPLQLVRAIRDWLQTVKPDLRLPGGDEYVARYEQFRAVREKLASDALLLVTKLTYLDRVHLIEDWLVSAASSAVLP